MAEKKNILTIYNICRDLVVQAEEYAASNNGEVDPAILPPLKDAFEQVIEFEKVHLITAHDIFYGSMLMNMDTKVDFTIRGAIDISVKKEPFVVSFNPLFCAKYKYSEFTALLISEILKLAYAHPATYSKINRGKDKGTHELLEKSSSASVSEMVQNDIRLDKKDNIRLVLPKDAYTVSRLTNDVGVNPQRSQSLEYYYKVLENFTEKQEQDPGQSMSAGSPQQGEESKPATANNNNGKDVHQWEDGDSEDQKERIKSMVSEVYNNMSEKHRGTMPGKLVEQIQALLKKPEISWKQVLRKFVGTIPIPHRSTKTRLNRRQPYRADLSGQLPKRLVKIVVAIDTSGSMSNDDIEYVMNEIFNIVKDYEHKITIIECDMEINKVYEAKKLSDVQTKVSGRGGTAFTPVIEYLNETGYYRDALMIYFTDGYGENTIPKPRTLRNMWVVLQDESLLSLKEPYGEVKALKKDPDWKSRREGY
jgi:predicted metal-dependent peptidase